MNEKTPFMKAAMLLVLGVQSVAGCASEREEANEPVRVDSADVAVVVNEGSDLSLEWEFDPVLNLGNVDEGGPTAFFGSRTPQSG